MKLKSYPLLFLCESQEILDNLFENPRIRDFFTKQVPIDFLKNIYTIHMTDQRLYNKFDYQIKAHVGIGHIDVKSEFEKDKLKFASDDNNP